MKAPDKIYLHGYPDKPFLCQDWDVSPTKRVVRGQQAENIAYIRKDALLEWAKDMKAETEDVIKQHPEDESLWAEMHWWEVVIGKLNSM